MHSGIIERISASFRRRTFRLFITLSVFFTILTALFTAGLLLYSYAERELDAGYQEEIERELHYISDAIDDHIEILDTIFPLITTNLLFHNDLDPASPTYHNKTIDERQTEIEKQMGFLLSIDYLWEDSVMNCLSLFSTTDGCVVHYTPRNAAGKAGSYAETVFHEMKSDDRTLVISIPDTPATDMLEDSIYFVRNMFSLTTNKRIACAVLDVSKSAWLRSFSFDINDEWIAVLFNPASSIIWNNTKMISPIMPALLKEVLSFSSDNVISLRAYNDRKWYYTTRPVTGTTFRVGVAAPVAGLAPTLEKRLRYFLEVYIVISLCALAIAAFLSYLITMPLRTMIGIIDDVAKKTNLHAIQHDIKPTHKLFGEFRDLDTAFNHMLAELDRYYTELYEHKLLLKNAEFKALQAQISPHFFFNVLSTIAVKAENSGDEDVYRMIIALSELLHANILSVNRNFVTLDEEIHYAEFYLYLEHERFGDRLAVKFILDKKIAAVSVPRFCVQPLVENAVQHGIESISEGGRVEVRVTKKERSIRIEVCDNGPGFPEGFHLSHEQDNDDDNNDINNSSDNEDDAQQIPRHPHIGLCNLNERLIMLYNTGLSLERRADDGTTTVWTVVSFTIPMNDDTLHNGDVNV